MLALSRTCCTLDRAPAVCNSGSLHVKFGSLLREVIMKPHMLLESMQPFGIW